MKTLKHFLYQFLILALSMSLINCKGDPKKQSKLNMEEQSTITKTPYGKLPDGTVIDQYTLKNTNGMTVGIITYGGIITSWTAPNKEGVYEDVVLGYTQLEEYLNGSPYFGALIGRYGNRIAQAKFALDGKEYTLAVNDGPNHLHGGLKGFDKVVWNATQSKTDSGVSLVLRYLSAHMEEGYPGNLETTVTYTLTPNNELEVKYQAITDQKTVVNLTQHSYFNLSADFSKPIVDHQISIDADSYLPVDETLIPTGEFAEVQNTPFDFRKAKTIGKDIDTDHDQLKKGLGYDHCWVLNHQNQGLRFAASAHHKKSGRLLEVYTDEPGMQFYTGNFLDGTLPNKQGGTYAHRTGFCLETQHYPDSPNQENFPSVILNPGETYTTKTIFKFSVK